MANIRTKLQFKRGKASVLPVLEDGEPGFCTDTKELYVGFEGENYKMGGSGDTLYIKKIIMQSENGSEYEVIISDAGNLVVRIPEQ